MLATVGGAEAAKAMAEDDPEATFAPKSLGAPSAKNFARDSTQGSALALDPLKKTSAATAAQLKFFKMPQLAYKML